MRLVPAMLILASAFGAGVHAATAATVAIDVAKPGITVPDSLWGVFFEEINHAGEGGIYGELIQNRSFEETTPIDGTKLVDGNCVGPDSPHYQGPGQGRSRKGGKTWSQPWKFASPYPSWNLENAGAGDSIALASEQPLNAAQSQYLTMQIGAGSNARLTNDGFWGVPAKQGEIYHLSFWARAKGFSGALSVGLIDVAGKVIASAEIASVSAGTWTKYTATFTSSATDGKAKFFLQPKGAGTLDLDVVSLFGKTYQDRPNGFRPDLVEKLQGLKPAFLRFPGGCVVEGPTLESRVQWKKTIGPIEERPGTWSLWKYRSSDGLGFHEYLQLCEDIGAQAMYVINVGISCEFRNGDFAPDDVVPAYIQDTLDAIEYATGPVTSTWGAKRAAAGHPAPFRMKYIEIGNENHGELYRKRYDTFYAALKAKHPELTYILNVWNSFRDVKRDDLKVTQPIEMIDEHYYVKPEWFFEQVKRYDTVARDRGYGSYLGEYACNDNVGHGNHLAAISEAAFMLGLERNSDVVHMASYAPLFFNVNRLDWKVNLIGYDNLVSFGRSSYWVQYLFSQHKADVILPTSVDLGADAKAQVYAQAGLAKSSGEVIVKLVNATADTVPATLALSGVAAVGAQAKQIVLTGDPKSENSVANPTLIVPQDGICAAGGPSFTCALKPWSLTVLRVPTKR